MHIMATAAIASPRGDLQVTRLLGRQMQHKKPLMQQSCLYQADLETPRLQGTHNLEGLLGVSHSSTLNWSLSLGTGTNCPDLMS